MHPRGARTRRTTRAWAYASGVAALGAISATYACVGEGLNEPPRLLQGIGTNIDASADADAGPLDAGEIVVLAAGVAPASSIAVDTVNVYWTDEVGAVWSVPRGGGTPALVTTGQSGALGLVVLGNGYWVSGSGSTAGSIEMVDFATGTLTRLAAGIVNPFGLAASPTRVYWTSQNPMGTAVLLSAIEDDAGSSQELANIGGAEGPGSLAIDADNAYFALAQPGGAAAVLSVPLAGGPPGTVWSAAGDVPVDLVVGTGAVYWLETSPAAVWSAPAGATPAVLASGIDRPAHLCVDETMAYWSSPGDGQVFAVPLAGGSVGTMAANLIGPSAVAVDADAIYVATVDSILKVAK
jgi:hypothetical protein